MPVDLTTIVGSDVDTLDHVLYSKNSIELKTIEVTKYLSDHLCVSAEFEIL